MKRSLIIIYIVFIIIFIMFLLRWTINESFISNYNDGRYNLNKLNILSVLNIPQSYIVHYNKGNVFYKNEDYDSAIEQYEKALKLNPPRKYEECKIRINLALAKLAKINWEDKSSDNIEYALDVLYDAREVLCEDGCAHENDNNGHCEDAEKLKKDIDDMIDKLENEDSSEEESEDENSNEGDNEEENEEESDTDEMEEKEEQLRQQQSQANQERMEEMKKNEYYRNRSSDSYYRGKRW